MASVDSGAHPPRISDADRESALMVLRESAVDGRVSHDTFLRRMELVLAARFPEQLHALLADLPARTPPSRPPGRLIDGLTRAVALPRRLRLALQAGRLPQLVLPAPGPAPLTIGRAPGSALRLSHPSVSRHHAQLRGTGTGWLLRDLGSSNGTWVNARRVADAVPVGPGDQVRFGAMSFRLAARELPR
ncbi:DUF1707 and FHA domain-containing protein [Streptomyces sp. DSM 44917]|uniref:DUF1707 and FHA domain-containing protein n=1 Tax=Streptomyces boetiae TaxID=3075541 RepID=A0ABU2L2D3_9ACTN|nr:DUF1707 and FHA domain-containing protein [Streptomyces sp. DSM 44917]MDT0305725.1 DUF1707 and FHA domain-containing protein [Streptomyces sp. DSM 44917]